MNTNTQTVFICQNKETREFVSHTTFRNEADIGWKSFNYKNVVKYTVQDLGNVRSDLWMHREDDEWNGLLPYLVWHKLTITTSWVISPP